MSLVCEKNNQITSASSKYANFSTHQIFVLNMQHCIGWLFSQGSLIKAESLGKQAASPTRSCREPIGN